MSGGEIAMLAGGIVVLVIVLGLIIYCVVKQRSYKGLLAILPLAVIMIGFSSIQSFSVLGAEVELRNSLAAAEENPEDEATIERLESAVVVMERKVSDNDASAEVAVNLARGYELLKQTDSAYKWAQAAAIKEPESRAALELVERTELLKLLPQDPNATLSVTDRSKIDAAVKKLEGNNNLSAESHLALSRAQLAINEPDKAKDNLRKAREQKPQLQLRPELKALAP